MLKLYDVVRLKKPDEQNGIKTTYEGTIVDVLAGGQAYIVEFFDEEGNTIEKSLLTEYTDAELALVWEFHEQQ